jgi:hypothetical protein
MDHEDKLPAFIHGDDGIAGFVIVGCVDDAKERVEESRASSLLQYRTHRALSPNRSR